jgi:hypothetical protein
MRGVQCKVQKTLKNPAQNQQKTEKNKKTDPEDQN